MLKREVFPYYRKCNEELSRIYGILKERFEPDYADLLCQFRGYTDGEQKELIKNWELGYCVLDDSEILGEMRKELGLVSDKDYFILSERFIIPVYDIAGNLSALIGYYPDFKKYITTPSPYFSKECMFFNYREAYNLSMSEYGGFIILVEGIFDCLSLTAIGLPCIATMGSSVSKLKCELLRPFKKVLAIPDDDKTGRRALDRYGKYGWNVPSSATFLQFKGGYMNFLGTRVHCKDMDNFVSWYDASDVREILLSYRDSKEDIEVLSLENPDDSDLEESGVDIQDDMVAV